MDSSSQKLAKFRQSLDNAAYLWILGEVDSALLMQIPPEDQILTNRLSDDPSLNVRLHINDFDLTALARKTNQQNTHALMRLSKEKLLNQHVIIAASRHLSGITLIGQKSEGIKAYQKFSRDFFDEVSLKKDQQDYWLHCTKPYLTDSSETISDYLTWQPISYPALEQPYWSKAGVFSRNHVDPGTAILIDTLLAKSISFTEQSILDLGCGSGLLSLISAKLGATNITAADNNATAILATEKNFATLHNNLPHVVQTKAVLSHIDNALEPHDVFDAVLCNPPFHQGFDHKKSLTQDFFDAISRRLKPSGTAWVVVNQFIAAQLAASASELSVLEHIEQSGFSVLQLKA